MGELSFKSRKAVTKVNKIEPRKVIGGDIEGKVRGSEDLEDNGDWNLSKSAHIKGHCLEMRQKGQLNGYKIQARIMRKNEILEACQAGNDVRYVTKIVC